MSNPCNHDSGSISALLIPGESPVTCTECGAQTGTITLTPLPLCGKPVTVSNITGFETRPCVAEAGHTHGCTLVIPA